MLGSTEEMAEGYVEVQGQLWGGVGTDLSLNIPGGGNGHEGGSIPRTGVGEA